MILAFTGAGISKASGIPTFTDQGDMRTKLDRYYSRKHPEEYRRLIEGLQESCDRAEPNDAHIALAEYDIPVITMNVDGLHSRAGSNHLLEIHGRLPNIVLYGDPAPLYSTAMEWITRMDERDILLIIGTSFYTNISGQMRDIARVYGARVVILNDKAEVNVRTFIENNKASIEDFDSFMDRELR